MKSIFIAVILSISTIRVFPQEKSINHFYFFIRSTSTRFVGEGAHFYWINGKVVEAGSKK